MHCKLWLQFSLFITLVAAELRPAHAYENGLYVFGQPFTQAYQQMLSSPESCLSTVESQLVTLNSAHSIQSHQLNLIKGHQLGALCALRSGLIDQAKDHINTAIQLAGQAELPLQSSISQTILGSILTNTPQSISLAQACFDKANQQIKPLEGHEESLLRFEINRGLGLLAINSHQLNKAKAYLVKANEIAQTNQEQGQLGWAEAGLGYYYLILEQAELALAHYSKAKQHAKGSLPTALLLNSEVEYRISQIYLHEGESDKAIEHLNSAIQIAQSLGDKRLTAQHLASLAALYHSKGNNNLALAHYLNAHELADQGEDHQLEAEIKYQIGLTYISAEQYLTAQTHLNHARYLFKQEGNKPGVISTLLTLGETQIKNSEPGLAVLQLEKAERLASSLKEYDWGPLYQLLSTAYEKNKNYHQALIQFKRYHYIAQHINQLKQAEDRANFIQHAQYIEQDQQLSDLIQENTEFSQQVKYHASMAKILFVTTVVCFILFAVSRHRNRQLCQSGHKLSHELHYHPYTDWHRLEYCSSPLVNLNRLSPPLENSQYILINLKLVGPLSLDRTLDFSQCRDIEKTFATHLKQHIPKSTTTAVLGNHHYLLRMEKTPISTSELCTSLLKTVGDFITSNKLNSHVAIGCCETPFFAKDKTVVDDKGTTEIVFLALEGAIQLVTQTKTSHWVELKALPFSPTVSFGSDTSQGIKLAIEKGLIKTSSSADKATINW